MADTGEVLHYYENANIECEDFEPSEKSNNRTDKQM